MESSLTQMPVDLSARQQALEAQDRTQKGHHVGILRSTLVGGHIILIVAYGAH